MGMARGAVGVGADRAAGQPPAWTSANAIPQTHERRTASEHLAPRDMVCLPFNFYPIRATGRARPNPATRPAHLINVVPDVQEARGRRHPDQTVHDLDEALDDGDVELPAREKESHYQPLRCAVVCWEPSRRWETLSDAIFLIADGSRNANYTQGHPRGTHGGPSQPEAHLKRLEAERAAAIT